jgi:hypothetical protein
MDKMSLPWDRDVVDFRAQAMNKTPQATYAFLKSKQYEYLLVEAYCIKRCAQPQNQTQESLDRCSADFHRMLAGIMAHKGFERTYYDDQAGMFRIK